MSDLKRFIARLVLVGDAEEAGKELIVKTTRSHEKLDVEVIFSESTDCKYCGFVLLKDLESIAVDFEIPVKEFLDETMMAITTHNGLTNFRYFFKRDTTSNRFRFSWKKSMQQVNLIYGSIELKKQNQNQSLLLETIEQMNDYKEQIESLKSTNKSLETENQELRANYEILLDGKNSIETLLYSKFRLILNTKKDKIRELEAKLEVFNRQKTKEADFVDASEDDEVQKNTRKRRSKLFSQSSTQGSGSDEFVLKEIPKRTKEGDDENDNSSLIESFVRSTLQKESQSEQIASELDKTPVNSQDTQHYGFLDELM